MSTYRLIRALAAKGFNWTEFIAALRGEYVALATKANHVMPSLAQWDAAITMRGRRTAAMEMAAAIVDYKSKRSARIPPSEETLAWGGFLGGSVEVWIDRDAEATATGEIETLIHKFMN